MVPSTDADVLIVGAGAAGSAAALELTRCGVNAVVVTPAMTHQRPGYVVVPRELAENVDHCGCARMHEIAIVERAHASSSLPQAGMISMHRRCWRDYLESSLAWWRVPRFEGRVLSVDQKNGLAIVNVSCRDGSDARLTARHVIDSVSLDRDPAAVPNGWISSSLVSGNCESVSWHLDRHSLRNGFASRVVERVQVDDSLVRVTDVRVLAGSHRATVWPDSAPPGLSEITAIIPPVSSRWITVGIGRGLVNLFTGHSASLGWTSGRIAGAAVIAHRDDADMARRSYERRLRGAVFGSSMNFDVGRHKSAFRTLLQSMPDQTPYSQNLRRAALLPMGFLSLSSNHGGPFPSGARSSFEIFESTVDTLVGSVVARYWPVGALAGKGGLRGSVDLRPSLFFGRCYELSGGTDLLRFTRVGAALDLTAFAGFALLVGDSMEDIWTREADFRSGGAVMSADFCLAHALRLSAIQSMDILSAVSGWIVNMISIPQHERDAAQFFGSAYEMAGRLGAQLSPGVDQTVARLGETGAALGRAVAASEESLARKGLPNQLGVNAGGFHEAGLCSRRTARSPVAEQEARYYSRAAIRWVSLLPVSPARERLLETIRQVPHRTLCGVRA